MLRSWLIILALFAHDIFHGELFVDSVDDRDTCLPSEQLLCNAQHTYPKLVRRDGVQVGHVQKITLHEGKILQLITRSLKPLVFEIPDVLNTEECEHIIKLANGAGLVKSETLPDVEDEEPFTYEEKKEACNELHSSDRNEDGKVSAMELITFINETHDIILDIAEVNTLLKTSNFDKDGDGDISLNECMDGDHLLVDQYMKKVENNHSKHRTRVSQQTWLQLRGSEDPVLRHLQERVAELTELPREILEHSEDLQVVQYGVKGHYHAHYDSSVDDNTTMTCCRKAKNLTKCSLCRFLTILYYLNDVPQGGETAFPVADESNFNKTMFDESDLSNLSSHCHDANLVIRPRRGKAIMWYNHMISNETGLLGKQDEYSLHGGCDVLEGQKWIANNWIYAPFDWANL